MLAPRPIHVIFWTLLVLPGCNPKETDITPEKAKTAPSENNTSKSNHAKTTEYYKSIIKNKNISSVDWDKVSKLAHENPTEFGYFVDYGSDLLSDTPSMRDEFFRRCISFMHTHEAEDLIKFIEQHGRGHGKKMAYGSLIGDYADDPKRLKTFIDQMPFGEPRSKGFQRYYSTTTKTVEDFESGLRAIIESDSPEDRKGIRLGLKQSGESLISNGKVTAAQLNSIIDSVFDDQENLRTDFKF